MSKKKQTSAAGAVAVKAEKAETVAEVAVFTPDENTSVAVRIDRAAGTLWLTQAEIAALFGCSRVNITQHLKAAEAEELAGLSVCKDFWLFCKIGHGIPCPICHVKQYSPSTTGCEHANDRPLWAFDGPGAVFTCSQPCAARFGSMRCEQAA